MHGDDCVAHVMQIKNATDDVKRVNSQ